MSPLEQLLRRVREKTLAVVVTLTEPDMAKTSATGASNLFIGRVRKRTRQSCYLGSSYVGEVNAQRAREGKPTDFTPKPRRWGTHVEGTPLVEHKGQLYLEYLPDQVDYVRYELDGAEIPRSVLEPWLKPMTKNSRQGVNNEVVIRAAKLENVVSVHFRKAHRNYDYGNNESDAADELTSASHRFSAQVDDVAEP